MKALEVVGGFALGVATLVIVFFGSIFAFGSMGRYMKAKNM
jgi:hypothetical protein